MSHLLCFHGFQGDKVWLMSSCSSKFMGPILPTWLHKCCCCCLHKFWFLSITGISNKLALNRAGNCKRDCKGRGAFVPTGSGGLGEELSTRIGSVTLCGSASRCRNRGPVFPCRDQRQAFVWQGRARCSSQEIKDFSIAVSNLKLAHFVYSYWKIHQSPMICFSWLPTVYIKHWDNAVC